jgi:formate hydrogenlyase subunit 6/NADH:ubiquinone oxidoreductase subunit I
MIDMFKRAIEKALKPFTKPLKFAPAPKGFRGKIVYDRDKCIGCGLCVRFCPSLTIKMKANRKIKLDLTECCYCGTCQEVCPVKCIELTNEYNLVNTNRKSKELKVE